MTRILERAGYAVPRRGRGSHLRLAAKGRAVAFVPVEGSLSPTATARLLALVDATPADLPALLATPDPYATAQLDPDPGRVHPRMLEHP